MLPTVIALIVLAVWLLHATLQNYKLKEAVVRGGSDWFMAYATSNQAHAFALAEAIRGYSSAKKLWLDVSVEIEGTVPTIVVQRGLGGETLFKLTLAPPNRSDGRRSSDALIWFIAFESGGLELPRTNFSLISQTAMPQIFKLVDLGVERVGAP